MPVDFVILCLGRTGSSHLCTLLESHPEVHCESELFHQEPVAGSFGASPYDDHRAFLEQALGRGPEMRGFKLPVESMLAYPQVLDILDDRGLRVIRLSRPNRLSHLVSARMAQATGIWHVAHGEQPPVRLRLELEECLAWFRETTFWDAILDRISRFHPAIQVRYGELNEASSRDALCAFLGVETRPLHSELTRQRRRPLAEVVENWDEIAAGLLDTPWERFATEAE